MRRGRGESQGVFFKNKTNNKNHQHSGSLVISYCRSSGYKLGAFSRAGQCLPWAGTKVRTSAELPADWWTLRQYLWATSHFLPENKPCFLKQGVLHLLHNLTYWPFQEEKSQIFHLPPAPTKDTNLWAFWAAQTYQPPAWFSHWNNAPASSALITCMAGSTPPGRHGREGEQVEPASRTAPVPDGQVIGGEFPSSKLLSGSH